MVRCVHRQGAATAGSAATASAYTLCTLHGRSAILPDSRAVCTVLSLTPMKPSTAAAPPLAQIAGGGPLPIGLASWPIDEICRTLLDEAQNDGLFVGYDVLDEMGLDLDSEVVQQSLLPPAD